MAHKKGRSGATVSDKCFCLLDLKHERQNDAKVLKVIVNEVDVLRLCRSLGMAVSDGENTSRMNKFELGLFNPSTYDADFSRFVRDKLVPKDGDSDGHLDENQDDEEQLEIGCLFGKQLEVKAELVQMGLWGRECEERLSFRDQGVYCLERDGGSGSHRQFVVFAWLNAGLFGSETIRDTPAYVLRFLLSLSSNITCCLLQEDIQRVKSEADAAFDSASMRRHSCSIALQVQKQEEKSDSICCSPPVKASIPQTDEIKSIEIVGGVFPAIVIESAVPSLTEWVSRNDMVNCSDFAGWIVEMHQQYAVKLMGEDLLPVSVRENLLIKFDEYPHTDLYDLQVRLEKRLEESRQQIGENISGYTKELHAALVKGAKMLFAVRCPKIAVQMDSALELYELLLQHLKEFNVFNELINRVRTRLSLPERIQSNLKMMENVFQNGPLAFEEVLEGVVNDTLTDIGGNNRGLIAVAVSSLWNAAEWMFGPSTSSKRKFRCAMKQHQPKLLNMWVDTVAEVMPMLSDAMQKQNSFEQAEKLRRQCHLEQSAVKNAAFANLRTHLMNREDRHLNAQISIKRLTLDKAAASVDWSVEMEKEPTKVVHLYELPNSSHNEVSLLGSAEFEPGFELIKLSTVKTSLVVAILVKEDKTRVCQVQFPVQTDEMKADQFDVRTFPKACSLCSVRVLDRRVAFLFDGRDGRLGEVALCRFNESFTSIGVTRNITMDTVLSLAAPLMDILLTERSVCALNVKGDMQSYDIRSGQTSKKTSFSDNKSKAGSGWVGGLLCVADELVVGRARMQNKQLCVNFVSSEDHRDLPSVTIADSMMSKGLSIGCVGDVLYVLDSEEGAIFASQLKVTVRSDAYRIQQSGNGLLAGRKTGDDATEHWLRVFYHVFEKFPVRSLIDETLCPSKSFIVELGVAVFPDSSGEYDVVATANKYFVSVMNDLKRLNKPLSGLDLATKVTSAPGFQVRSVRRVLTTVVSFVPVQMCRAEDNMLHLLRDGEENTMATRKTSTSPGKDATEIAQSIRFGLLSPLLESWNGRCVVVTSMGKQSTGKSYFLNHLTGTTFAISGSRCTDGAWMSVRFLPADVLLVVLDFEGLGSFERSEQEDIFLSVLNASVSMFTVFRMDSRFDKEIDSLFSRFQKGVRLIKDDPRLFRGPLYMSVKDVNMNDQQQVFHELSTKLRVIFEADKAQNFLTDMYAGQLVINCTPPLGTMDYYENMKVDAARTLCAIVAPTEEAATGIVTGKAFLECLRLVLSKISILDWTSMEEGTERLLVADVKQKLPGICRTGCHVSHSLVAKPTIPFHLKEDVLHVGTREKIVISLQELCQAHPNFTAQWMALNDIVPLNNVKDEALDFGFDVTVTMAKTRMIKRKLMELFKEFLASQGKEYGTTKLSTEDQSTFDTFMGFILRRRAMKATQWLCEILDDRLAETRSQLKQQYVDAFELHFARCQHKCARCQLGCMRSITHGPGIKHNCSTDHICRGFCEYGECQDSAESGEIPACSRSAGHEGKCECAKGEHSCGQTCFMSRAPNCDKTCSLLADHPGDHRCSVQVHVCGESCSAATCRNSCLLDIQRSHTVHKCAEVRCLHPCLMEGCTDTCGEKNHFHGQVSESRTFAKESGVAMGNKDECVEDVIPATITHICSSSHACGELCKLDGICEQKVNLRRLSRMYPGARGPFEYVFQEMNGNKKHCTHVIPSGEVDHDGLEHSCVAQNDDDQNTVHYCDVRCPCCSYYCNKHFGHMGLHDTSHGNMRRTYFLAKDKDVDVEDRKYQVGEHGIAEMCNLFCSKMGRGHVHYLLCEAKGGEGCVYAAGVSDPSTDHRRHCVDELFPPPDREMDQLLHAKFWSTMGWVDPCNEEERALFAKCCYQCNAPEHGDGDDKPPSYCVLNAWHQPELRPEGADTGFSYVDGHKFECIHATDSGKFHHVFVLDSSGSMSGQPWNDLLYACNEFTISRMQTGGENDLVSYITFDNESYIHSEREPLSETSPMLVPYSGGGTSFEQGLRAASEVLSRNDFEEFKAVVIFFSDGNPWDFELGITLAQHIRSTYAKYDLKAFVVGLGRLNLPVLERMASEMGGEYRQALDANALRTEFQRITAVLCSSEASLALMEVNDDSPSV